MKLLQPFCIIQSYAIKRLNLIAFAKVSADSFLAQNNLAYPSCTGFKCHGPNQII